jgi:hypothetical protein
MRVDRIAGGLQRIPITLSARNNRMAQLLNQPHRHVSPSSSGEFQMHMAHRPPAFRHLPELITPDPLRLSILFRMQSRIV